MSVPWWRTALLSNAAEQYEHGLMTELPLATAACPVFYTSWLQQLIKSLMSQVNDDWILRRLEQWGKKEQMPFLGQKKGAILQQLVEQQQPKLAVEVGTMAGYSAITIAQVCCETPLAGAIHITGNTAFETAAGQRATSVSCTLAARILHFSV